MTTILVNMKSQPQKSRFNIQRQTLRKSQQVQLFGLTCCNIGGKRIRKADAADRQTLKHIHILYIYLYLCQIKHK